MVVFSFEDCHRCGFDNYNLLSSHLCVFQNKKFFCDYAIEFRNHTFSCLFHLSRKMDLHKLQFVDSSDYG